MTADLLAQLRAQVERNDREIRAAREAVFTEAARAENAEGALAEAMKRAAELEAKARAYASMVDAIGHMREMVSGALQETDALTEQLRGADRWAEFYEVEYIPAPPHERHRVDREVRSYSAGEHAVRRLAPVRERLETLVKWMDSFAGRR